MIPILAKKYVNPQYRAPWITEGEVVLMENERFAVFSILDGQLAVTSTQVPAFLESLRAPELPPQGPVLVVSEPKISRIARVDNTTEIVVSAESASVATFEFAESIGGIWSAVPAYPVPLSIKAGSSSFTHTTESPATFYRLRVSSSPQ